MSANKRDEAERLEFDLDVTLSALSHVQHRRLRMARASELIDSFCDQVWLQDGLAASSLASYRRDLNAWADWLQRCAGKISAPGSTKLLPAFCASRVRMTT